MEEANHDRPACSSAQPLYEPPCPDATVGVNPPGYLGRPRHPHLHSPAATQLDVEHREHPHSNPIRDLSLIHI
eukprot:11802051-Prorocentrum_lima.AAC.1